MVSNAQVALLLEDEPLIAVEIEMILDDAGFDVTTVTSCQEAFNWVDNCRPDIVIVDIVLRDGSCHAVVEKLIADGIPFVIHSGDTPSRYEGTPFAEGPWIGKPVNGGELIEVIRSLLALPRAN